MNDAFPLKSEGSLLQHVAARWAQGFWSVLSVWGYPQHLFLLPNTAWYIACRLLTNSDAFCISIFSHAKHYSCSEYPSLLWQSSPASAPRLLSLHQHWHSCHGAMCPVREAGWLETNSVENTTKQITAVTRGEEGRVGGFCWMISLNSLPT